MKLLELCLSPDLGGLELYMVRAAHALDTKCDVISVINPKGKLEQYYKETSFRYELIEKKSNVFMFGAARKLAKIIDENGIDVVHLHWTKDIPLAVLAKILSTTKPKLVQTRNMTMTRFKDDFYHRFLYKNMDLMLPVTQQVANQIHKFIPEDIRPKVEVLYMGSDKPELLSEDELIHLRNELGMNGGFNVGLVGRIEETKGQHLLIDAIAILREQGHEVDAFFVGHEMEEGYIDILKNRANDKGIDENIHFLGFMKNPHQFYQACDAIVLATECETFGLVVIEAMAAGTPVIATNQCGPLEIIDDGNTGLLFKKQDPQSLSHKILDLHDDVLHEKISEEAVKKVKESFSNEKQFTILKELCNTLVID